MDLLPSQANYVLIGQAASKEGKLLIEMKEMLQKTGYYLEEINDIFDGNFEKSLKKFHLTENFDERIRADAYIDKEVLEFLVEYPNNKYIKYK